MEQLLKNSVSSLSLKTMILMLAILLLIFASSCSETDACRDENTGTFRIENTNSEGLLRLNFNKPARAGNSPGDESVDPGEIINVDLPAGQIIIYASLIKTSCSGRRCQVQSQGLASRTVDLDACEVSNLVY